MIRFHGYRTESFAATSSGRAGADRWPTAEIERTVLNTSTQCRRDRVRELPQPGETDYIYKLWLPLRRELDRIRACHPNRWLPEWMIEISLAENTLNRIGEGLNNAKLGAPFHLPTWREKKRLALQKLQQQAREHADKLTAYPTLAALVGYSEVEVVS